MAAIVLLRYEGRSADRFDRAYYCGKHMSSVVKSWKSFGLLDARVFFPAAREERPGTVCICQCVFADEASAEAAFASIATRDLVEDIVNFTDLTMKPSILKPLAFGVGSGL